MICIKLGQNNKEKAFSYFVVLIKRRKNVCHWGGNLSVLWPLGRPTVTVGSHTAGGAGGGSSGGCWPVSPGLPHASGVRLSPVIRGGCEMLGPTLDI